MNDVFLEQIVNKRDGLKDKLIKGLILSCGVLLFLFFIFLSGFTKLFGTYIFVVGAGFIALAWYIVSGLNLEFEYIYTNGEIDIDKISAKRKRKRLMSVRVSLFQEFGIYNHEEKKAEKYDIRYYAGINPLEPNSYYAVFPNKDGQKCLLVFNPNEKLLEKISGLYKKRGIKT